MGTLSWEVTLIYIVAFPSQEGFTLKGKNLLLLEQILCFKSRPYFERTALSRKVNKKSQKLFPFVKKDGKPGGVHVHLKKASRLHARYRKFQCLSGLGSII